MTLFRTTLISLVAFAKLTTAQDVISIHGERTHCDTNPCQNDGICRMRSGTDVARQFVCECRSSWTGVYCDIPYPQVDCGKGNITVTVDQRLIAEHQLDTDTTRIAFSESEDPSCHAVVSGENYLLTLQSPFSKNCGTIASRGEGGSGNFIFNNRITWRKVYAGAEGEAPIERTINLLDFTCEYEDEYLLHYVPITPAEAVIEEKISKGEFKVTMELFKDRSFASDRQLPNNPIVAIDEEVCVQMELSNDLGLNNLVLSVKDCWTSFKENASKEENMHFLIEDKCKAENEYTVDVIYNGLGAKTQFCFHMFKWNQDMDNVFLQCKINICDSSVIHHGVSQCQCPPEGFDVNGWIYPNYYASQFDYYRSGEVGESMYGDSMYYSNYYYYDYLAPEEDFRYQDLPESGRKKRSLPELQAGTKRKLIDTQNMQKNDDGTVHGVKVLKVDPTTDILKIGFGPIGIRDAAPTEAEWEAHSNVMMHEITDDGDWFGDKDQGQYTVMIAVGVALIACMIVLGVVIGTYVQCKRKWDKQTSSKIQELNKARALYSGVLKPHGPTYSNPSGEGKNLPAFIKAPE